MHVRQRRRVYETWGFADKGKRGLGISALFAGASGTGKTMAAEVLAHELRLDLQVRVMHHFRYVFMNRTERVGSLIRE